MEVRPKVSDMKWFSWLRNAPLRTGVLAGIYLSCLLQAWLLIANRVPELERYALPRNLAAAGAALLALATPVLRFRNHPGRMFVSGVTAWLLLTLTYRASELYYSLLESRMGAFQLFMLGAVSFGFVAVFRWVYLLCAEVRHRHIARADHAALAISRRRSG
jgi:hypothetical protein